MRICNSACLRRIEDLPKIQKLLSLLRPPHHIYSLDLRLTMMRALSSAHIHISIVVRNCSLHQSVRGCLQNHKNRKIFEQVSVR